MKLRTVNEFIVYYAYVIQSLTDQSFLYKGHCEHLEARLKQHNSGSTISIRHKIPFKLLYTESFASRIDAIKREKYFKSAAGRRYLQKKITAS